MSTRSIVAAKFADGRVGAIYTHFDGADHLPILEKLYNSQERVEYLIMLGDQSSLGEPYGDSNSTTTFLESMDDVFKLDWGQEYVYTWGGSGWEQIKCSFSVDVEEV